jgi:hypothetical protein
MVSGITVRGEQAWCATLSELPLAAADLRSTVELRSTKQLVCHQDYFY